MGERKRRLAIEQQMASKIPAIKAADVTNHQAQRWLETGLREHRSGNLVEAINAYQIATRHAPALPDAQHYQGLALYQMGQHALGLNLMQLSLRVAANNAQFHFNLGNALRTDNLALALQHVEQAAVLDPNDVGFAVTHADLLWQANCQQEAIMALQRALALSPARIDILCTLSDLHYSCNQLDAALLRFSQALALNSKVGQDRQIGFAKPDIAPVETKLSLADLRNCTLADDTAVHEFATQLGLHIIDNFLPDPIELRAKILQKQFHASRYAGQNFPGVQTEGQPCQEIMDRIASAVGRTIKFRTPDNGCYRVSFADSAARTDIHVDNESGDNFKHYAAVLYLTLPEQSQGGTTFWRHVPTGWQRRPNDTDVRAAGFPNFKAFQQRWLSNKEVIHFNKLKDRRDSWKLLLEVPMRFNRLIMYQGHHFHSISDVFGSTLENGRLVQLFAFEVID
ncbi:MAG: DUF6445 family protein [Pseudomonadota bacterium]